VVEDECEAFGSDGFLGEDEIHGGYGWDEESVAV
jgi:hypothetical protein